MSALARRPIALMASLLAGLAMDPSLAAEAAGLRAQQVYESSCAACHGPGTAKAPRLGDKARWTRLDKFGQARITAIGWLGEGAMPPRGGQPELSLQDFSDATAYMARRSGQAWVYADEPWLQRLQSAIEAEQRKRRKP